MPDGATPRLPRGEVRVRLELSPPLREMFLGIVGKVFEARAKSPDARGPAATQAGEPPDTDLQSAWMESLRERDEHDTEALHDLLLHPKFGSTEIGLSPGAAEAVIRASASLRLHLRETLLHSLTAEQAEGHLEVFTLSPPEQQGYACFRLLAYLEEDLLVQLDPGLLKA